MDFTGTGAASANNNGQFECSVDRQQPQPCKREWKYSDPLYGSNKYDSNLCSKERSLEKLAALHSSVFIFQALFPVLSRYKSSGSDRPHSWDQVPREGPSYWLWSRLQSLEQEIHRSRAVVVFLQPPLAATDFYIVILCMLIGKDCF